MKPQARLTWVFPWMARLPGTLGWALAPRVGAMPLPQQAATRQFLAERFAQVFPEAEAAQCHRWAQAHLDMLALEQLDAYTFARLGMPGGPQVRLQGGEYAQQLAQAGQGFILVLNHFDRLLTAPVVLARQGLRLNLMTMPVADNPELDPVRQAFLLRKIRDCMSVLGGQWRTSDAHLRPVHESLRAGQAWVILADAWRPEFTRLREHFFLGGYLRLPTGIERLAQATGVPLLHAATYTDRPSRLRVVVEKLPDNSRQAVDAVIARLERDVRERPWAWWHWGQWEQMWRRA